MAFSEKELRTRYNLKQVNSVFFGKVDDFFISLEMRKSAKSAYHLTIFAKQNENLSSVKESIEKLNGIVDFQNIYNQVYIDINITHLSIVDFSTVIEEVVNIFHQYSFEPICSVCSKQRPNKIILIDNQLSAICPACIPDNEMTDTLSITTKQYFLGWVFSLSAGLLGSIVWIVFGLFGFMTSIAGFVIALCASYGYSFMVKRTNLIGIIILCTSIIISATFAEYVSVFIFLYRSAYAQNILIPFQKILMLTNSSFKNGEIATNTLLGYLFALLGSYRILIYAYKQRKAS